MKYAADTDGHRRIKLAAGHLFFLGFLVFTILAFKERLFNNDAGYYSFHLVNEEDFFIKHRRYINYLTQALPVLLVNLGASLKWSLISYSASFGLLFYFIYWCIAHKMRDVDGGLFLAGCLLLAMRYKHYAGHTEITVAIAVAALFFCHFLYSKKNRGRTTLWVTGLLSAWLFTIHPIIIIPLATLILLDMSYHDRWKDRLAWKQIGILLFFFGVRFAIVAMDPYESNKVSFVSNVVEVFAHSKEQYVWIIIIDYFFKELMCIPLLIFLAASTHFIYRKKYWTFAILHGAHLLLLLLIIAVHSYLRGPIYIMIDGYIGMLGMLWAYPLYVLLSEDQRGQKKWLLVLVIGLYVFCAYRIHRAGDFFRERLDMYQQVFDENPDSRKLFVPMHRFNWDLIWYPYEVPAESLMLSSLDSKDSRTIYIDYNRKGYDKIGSSQKFLYFGRKKDINKKYFSLPQDEYKYIEAVPWKSDNLK